MTVLPPATLAAMIDAIDPASEVRYRRVLAQEAAMAQAGRSWSEGYAAAIADVKRTEHDLVDVVRLATARSRPGGAAWLAGVERHGGTEFGGTGEPRVPVSAEVIEQARQPWGRTAR